MFDSLLESRAKTPTRVGGSLASTVVHALLIGGAVVFTANAEVAPDAPRERPTVFTNIKVKPPTPEPPRARARDAAAATRPTDTPPPLGVIAPVAPIDIPDALPPADLSKAVTTDDDLSALSRGRGRPDGVVGGTGSVEGRSADDVFPRDAVDRSVVLMPGSASPRYPEMLRASGVQGGVMMEFVVDTTGRAESGSLRVLQSDHPLFAEAVRSALARMRFVPAEVAGRKVRQLVQQPFGFALNR
ncbi:MAG: energy transducer TonB [Gemmatimonadota bacterium]